MSNLAALLGSNTMPFLLFIVFLMIVALVGLMIGHDIQQRRWGEDIEDRVEQLEEGFQALAADKINRQAHRTLESVRETADLFKTKAG